MSLWERFLGLSVWDRLDRLDERFGVRARQPRPRSKGTARTLAVLAGMALLLNAFFDWYDFLHANGSSWLLAAALLSSAAVPVAVVHFLRSAGTTVAHPQREWVLMLLLVYVTLSWMGGRESGVNVILLAVGVVVTALVRRRSSPGEGATARESSTGI